MNVSRYGVVLAALATGSMAVSGCSANSSIVDKAKNDKKLVIGVSYDQPGLGEKTASGAQGFDVDVAKYIAKKLGVTDEKNIELKQARPANRETFLQNGTVDLVVATYSITAARKPKVTFGGPYIVTHQDIMTRADDTSIKTVTDLKKRKKRLCQVAGSNSWKNVTEGSNQLNIKVPARLIPAAGYQDCVTKLKGNSVDAISTDATILAGFSAREPGVFKIDNAPLTDERYGVGLKKGDLKGCEAVNKAIAAMYSDGTTKQLWNKWFGTTGLTFDATPPAPEGCS
ncbi:MAG: glutamate transport system substrate-binding protein [Streptosporangiaceae bacterium]|jgi:glutamate transport system substrate-binding protein|nr:extracellular solute-binding protein family 3 [Streptosporangiaceae bacterium]MDX6427920.1 glutamate transport system substrate-binding protein [Streptosporangiaceae bacterium]